MTKALLMIHDTDPRDEIMAWWRPIQHLIKPMSDEVLVAVYERPAKTRGGVFLPDATKAEDRIQGKVGLVLAKGPLAFVEDEDHKWPVAPEVGDWVLYNIGDTFPFEFEERRCRLIREGNVRAILMQPDVAY